MIGTDNKTWKYCYWLDEINLAKLQKQMTEKGIEMVRAKRNPCEALQDKIGYAEPDTWSLICKYDAAPWYNNSKHSGEFIVTSSFPLDTEYSGFLETTITPVSFDPPYLPTKEEKAGLAKNKKYLHSEPPGWGEFPEEMGEAIVNGLAKMHGTTPEKFEDLLLEWTAAHSNFVNPMHRADNKFKQAPYSIADSAHVSSCCVELFNLLDSQEEALLVRPCIGIVIVKVLEKDRYYLVRIVKNKTAPHQ